ncbi:LssY C-terminal domain-containing protein [Bryobacter aggregatus]|uniref:LssY C-terminal domain-containing protein n=1 Tax=Bryobacter aggregatus TaxID=360054 RepID=UPI0004E1E847|nr:LssY C-terminal domain-containing protein [Bryobacter aggregatus]
MRFLLVLILMAVLCPAQTVTVSAEQRWVDSGVTLGRGDRFVIEASGELTLKGQNGASETSTPAGLARGFRDLLRILPLNSSGRGALIARIGDRETSQAFFVGASKDGNSPFEGKLFFNANLGANEKGTGTYTVKVTVTKAAVVEKTAAPVIEMTQAQLDSTPLRVVDAEGNEGDRVNFFIIGSEASVLSALKTAGWVQVDKSVRDSVINAILLSMSKQAYITMPMSELMMFGRTQDYGFAHAVPFVVVAQRHHFRIWKAPFQANGTDVWVGAGTHDIGFERDQRNNGITHKIDPETDKERDFIGQTLMESGMVIKQVYMTHVNPVKEAKTATGGSFHSDGQTQITYLEQTTNASATRFANYFCSVLATNPDGGQWGNCSDYIETQPDQKLNLPPMSQAYRVVVVPGIFSSCASDAPAFEQARNYLKEKQGVEAALLNIPNNSSEDNAKTIAKYLREEWAKDQRKFILVGYSKGTPDIQTALATEPEIRPMVASFISFAGASGGSPVADALPAKLSDLLGKLNGKGGCQGDLSDGFKSLSVEKRRHFLAEYPAPFVPTYSMPAVADKDKVSKAMVQSWTLLNSFSSRNDAQLSEVDAIIPGSTYLGAARSDHFALALPLENMQGGILKTFLDKNSYPRAALLESALRLVLDDLKAPAPAPKKSIFQP